MRIGYVCFTRGVYGTDFKTCTLKKATEENLLNIIDHNLNTLDKIIDYNIKMNIKFFRLSSDLIPFGSSEVNTLNWDELFQDKFQKIGEKIRENGIRTSMHPGQYTVLNSPNEDVVKRTVEDLEYHNRFLNALQMDKTSKLILHIGGVYGDKKSAIERFEKNYHLLSQEIKDRLIIENDDVSYNIGEVLEIGMKNGIPVVYDNLHNALLPTDETMSDSYYITLAGKTWKSSDGKQKIHYSQSANAFKNGNHSKTIDLEEFKGFVESIPDVDIMLEVKDKNISAIKVNNLLDPKKGIKNLEEEWARYKYNILERDQNIYKEIRTLLKDKKAYPIIEFYRLIDKGMSIEIEKSNAINAASHVWGYFKNLAEEKEKKKYDSYMQLFEKGTYSLNAVKNLLLKLAVKYNSTYLLESYYFHL